MPEDKEVSVNVILKPNDLYNPFLWSWRNLFRWVVSIVLCRVVYDVFFSPEASLRSFPDQQAIGTLVVVLTVFIVLGLLLFPYLRGIASFKQHPAFSKPTHYVFSADGVHFDREDANGDFRWSAFTRVYETRGLFIFQQTSYTGTYIPKRCLDSQTDIPRLRQMIQEHFRGKYRLRVD